LRIVCDGRAYADHDCVDQRPQAVQMGKARLAVDVMRVSGERGDAGVDRLAALADQNEIVDGALAQRPENVLPGLRQGTIAGAERFRYRRPR
jgi:hypothetical protein